MPVDASKVKELFFALLEMSADKQAAYLDTACAGDAALRSQVEAMLRCHANSGELLARSAAEMLRESATDAGVSGADAPQADPAATLADSAQVRSRELPFLTPSEKPGQLGQLGPYEVEKVLGKGGFGVVLKAFDERLHRVVAIKVLSPAYAAVGSARKRFSREARAAAAVKNEHVVGIHDVQGDADPPYLVMEYIDGTSLQDKIDRNGSLAVTEILRIGMQIAEGLAAAHKQGLVHRDIKPANILLENGVERIKITDFGLARTVDDASVTQSGTVAGTPMYMSPEQADGLPIDYRSDLFSLGTVLYAMCTGHPPFRATGTITVLKRVVEDTPRPIREINSEIPDWLCDIIGKLHAKKPEDRFQAATEVAELLGQRLADVQAGRTIQRQAERPERSVETPARPNPNAASVLRFASGMGIFVMLVVAVTAILIPLLTLTAWDIRSIFLAGIVVFAGCTGILWGLTATLKRTTMRSWVQPLNYAAIGFCVLTIGCVLMWLRHTLMPASATLELSFVHPTARVVLESDNHERREFASEKPGHGKTIADLAAGTYRLTVFVADKQVGTEEIVLTEGQRFDKAIEPTGRLQVTNESDEPVTIYGLVEPGTHLPPDDKSLQKMTRDVVSARSALVDTKLAGAYRWVRGDVGGECFVMPGQTAVLRIPKEAEPGWVQFFNGKDLTGWKLNQGKWPVKDGSIIADRAGELVSERAMAKNFRLRMELKLKRGAGVIRFRIPASGERDWNLALLDNRLGMMDGELHTGRGKESTGSVQKIAKMDEWIALELVSQDQEASVRINGKQVLYLHDEQYTPGPGHIGISIIGTTDPEGTELHVRKIEIKELPPSPPESAFQPLFNGTDASAWDMERADNWKFDDNRLICRGSGGMLRPKKLDLREFHLRIEARHFGEGAYLRLGPQMFQTPDKKSVIAHQHVLLSPVLISAAGTIGMDFGGKDLTGGVAEKDRTKPGEWYTLDVIHEGRYVRTLINGAQAAEFVVTEPGALVGLGLLGFNQEDKNGELQIRKIEIKELSADPNAAAKRLQGFWTPVEVIRGAVGKDAAFSKEDLTAVALDFDKDKLKCGLFPDAAFHLSAPNRITIKYRGPAKQMVSAEATYRLTHDILALDFADIDLPFGPAAPKTKDGKKPLQLALVRYHAGLVPLFNGKNLHGFVNDRERWTWQGDTLVGARRANDMQDDLLFRPSMPDLRDFELEFQARTQGQAPVGILFRGGENKENVALIANGPMLSIGGITPGGLWNRNLDQQWKIPPAEKIKAVKPDDFNYYVLRCVGKRVTVQINGVTMIDDDLDVPKMQPAGKLAWALLDNGKAGTVTFREIRLRALPPPQPPEPAFQPLFNGKDLTGWTNPKKDFDAWKVDKGVLIGTGDNAFLRSERGPFADFHLRMEAKYVGGTAGLVFREQSPDVAGAGYLCSMENNKAGDFNTGAISMMLTNNLLGTFAVPKQVLTQIDKWFTLEIVANGNRMQTLVDGKKAVNFVDIHHDFKEGFTALIARGKEGELHVKKIEVKELPPEERGWIQLFNGTDLNGWGKPRYHAKWEVVDGVLTGSAKPQKNGMLSSLVPPLTNFHLKAHAQISQEGNGGVLFRSTRESNHLVEFGGGKAGSLMQLSPYRSLVDNGQAVPPGQWFALYLIADGKRVTTKINGKIVADFADAAATSGQIEVEVDAGPTGSPATVEFRSIEVKELPAVKAGELNGKKDAHAQEAAVQFFKMFTTKNIDLLMNAVDIPFCREGGSNIEKRDDLMRFLQKALAVRDPSKDTITVKSVTTLAKFEESEGKLTDDERKAFQEVLGPDHRVVRLEWNRSGEGKHRILIFVRFDKGEAKIVGIL